MAARAHRSTVRQRTAVLTAFKLDFSHGQAAWAGPQSEFVFFSFFKSAQCIMSQPSLVICHADLFYVMHKSPICSPSLPSASLHTVFRQLFSGTGAAFVEFKCGGAVFPLTSIKQGITHSECMRWTLLHLGEFCMREAASAREDDLEMGVVAADPDFAVTRGEDETPTQHWLLPRHCAPPQPQMFFKM